MAEETRNERFGGGAPRSGGAHGGAAGGDREGGGRGRMRDGRGKRRPKFCFYCVEKTEKVDYKEVDKIRKYTSERGKIVPRRISGVCAKHQRQLTEAIKRARFMALLPFSLD